MPSRHLDNFTPASCPLLYAQIVSFYVCSPLYSTVRGHLKVLKLPVQVSQRAERRKKLRHTLPFHILRYEI